MLKGKTRGGVEEGVSTFQSKIKAFNNGGAEGQTHFKTANILKYEIKMKCKCKCKFKLKCKLKVTSDPETVVDINGPVQVQWSVK